MKKLKILEKAAARAKAKKKTAAAAKKAKAKEPKPEGVAMPMMGMMDKKSEKEKKEHGGFDRYEVEEACRTLEKAADILKDKKLLAAASKFHDNKATKVRSMAELKAAASKAVNDDY